MQRITIIVCWLISFLTHAQTYTVETVPNVKLVNNSYVSNPDSILSESTVSSINRKLADLEAQTTVQVAVVVIQSIGNEDHVDFAQQLFNRWGIGHPEKNNGLLILLVMDQRTVRFHTGYGLEGVLPDIVCKHIQMERMVPYFKLDDYNSGMVDGVSEVVDVLTLPGYAEELYDNSRKEASGWNTSFWIVGGIWFFLMMLIYGFKEGLDHFAGPHPDKSITYPAMRPAKWTWLFLYVAMPLIILLVFDQLLVADMASPLKTFFLALYGYLGLSLVARRLRMRKVVAPLLTKQLHQDITIFYQDQKSFWQWMAFFFPMPWLPAYFQYKAQQESYRNGARKCKSCQAGLEKLTEQTEDPYLNDRQIFEEQLKSVDYDVWLCRACGKHESFAYPGKSTQYSVCPKCKVKAFFDKGTRTITSPTYSATGTGETTKLCKFCNHKVVETFSIAMLEHSSSSSSSSSDSSYSSSSGSDSGGSWGGGSSGGGGASSSW